VQPAALHGAVQQPGETGQRPLRHHAGGRVHQFGPIGKGWIAWAQWRATGWYSIEHADNHDPNNPLTDAQIAASAQLVELLSGSPVSRCR